MSPRRQSFLVFAALAGVLALHAWHYWPFLSDEALVALRTARRLSSGQGLTWTDGERVEGSTSFLWALLHALFGFVGFGLIPTARALGFAGVLMALACAGLEPRRRGVSVPRLAVAGTFMVSTAPLAIWSIGGLEQGLVAGLVALSLRLVERSAFAVDPRPAWHAGIPLALIALLRSDGVFTVLALLAGAACLPRPSLSSVRRAAAMLIPAAVAVVVELAFRLFYYGDWMPSSLRTRATEQVRDGLGYAGSGFSSASMLVLLSLVATVFALRRGERFGLVMPWAVVLGSTASVALFGGDALPGFRALVPALVALCFLVGDEAAADWARIDEQRLLVLPIAGLCAFLHATQSTETAENRRARKEQRVGEELDVGLTLKAAFGAKNPLLAVERPGALPFGSELPSLDLTGRDAPSVGDGATTQRRAPDLVVFGEPSKPETAAGLKLFQSKRFGENYQSIRVEGKSHAAAEVWVRREHGRLGVVRKSDRIDVPGYFFSGQTSKASASLDGSGVLVTELAPRAPGVLPDFSVTAGRWRLDTLPPAPELVVDIRCDDLSMQRGAQGAERVFEVDQTTQMSIALAPKAGAHAMGLRSVSLTRVADAPSVSTCVPRGKPLRVPAELIAHDLSRSASWAHPSNLTFGRAGVVVDAGTRAALGRVEVSLSRNDAYSLELRRDGHAVWSAEVERGRAARGSPIVLHQFELPKAVEGGGIELFIRPRKGDSTCRIGHVELR